jgi:hypothetical protein
MPDNRFRRPSNPVLLIVKPFVWLYRTADRAFGLSQRGANRNLANLMREVRSDFSFLFNKYHCRVLPKESHGDPSMDHAIVVVDAGTFRLRAARDRGDTIWEVASVKTPQSWRQLQGIFKVIEPHAKYPYSTAELLERHFFEIETLISDTPLKVPTN